MKLLFDEMTGWNDKFVKCTVNKLIVDEMANKLNKKSMTQHVDEMKNSCYN